MKQFRYIICLLLVTCLSASAIAQQSRTISGLVLDEKSEPVIGASIIVPGTTIGTVTNLEGKFKLINVSADKKTIQISYVGYISQKVDIEGKSDVIVKMVQSNAELDEVVVVGYGVQKKAHMTGAISTVAPQDITDLSSTNLGSSLSGFVNGVSVSGGNGRPGDAATLTIRQASVSSAYSTISGYIPETSPLYVIDDYVSTETAFNNLDASMIESISILKDGSAAVYGARSAQGVVLVKTKRGKEGAPKISYNGQFGYTDEVARAKMLDTYNYGLIWNAVRAADPSDTWDNKYDLFQSDELAAMKNLNYDLLEREWSSALTQKHSLNLSGGSERANYFAGVSYITQDGNLGNIDYDRWNYRAGIDANINKWIKASLQVSGDYGKQNKSYNKIAGENGGETDYNYLLTHPRYMPDYVNGLPIAGYGVTNSGLEDAQLYNFKAIQNLDNYSKSMTGNMTINSSIEYDFGWSNLLKGLKVKISYSKSINTDKGNQYASNYSLYAFNNRSGSGEHLYSDDIDMSESNIKTMTVTNGNFLRRTMSRADSYQLNLVASYARKFGKHDLSGLFTIEKAESEMEDLVGEVLDPYAFTNGQSKSASGTQTTQFSRTESGILSYVGRFNYAYANKYLLEFLLRSDASTKFAPENYWGLFPSMSAGWVMSEETWFRDKFQNIDFFKLRGSFGLLGRDNIKAWRWLQTYGLNSDKGPIFGVSTGTNSGSHISMPDEAVNRYAHWDKSYKSNFGVDLNVLDGRLSMNLDAYYEWNRDVFMTRQGSVNYPATVGVQAAAENFGKIDAYGVEISIGWKDKIGKDFKYWVKLNTGYNDNKVLERAWEALIPFDKNHPGQRSDVGSWGYECIGMFRSYQDIEEYFEQSQIVSYMGLTKDNVRPGMLIYNNVRGSQKPDGTYYGPNDPQDPKAGYVDDNDRVQISYRSNPYGFTANMGAEWKNLSFSTQLGADWGGYSFIPSDARSISSLVSTATGYNVMQYTNLPSFWANNMFVYEDVLDAQGNVVASKNLDAKYPNLRYTVNNVQSTFWKVSGTRVTLRNITLAYTLPKAWVKKATIESCRFNLTAQNVLSLFNPYPDNFIDPMSGTYGSYPNLRKITLGVNVSF
jgi:TonB-linked SusC/RagA family outer membrane protein